jgi:hypothetical protein
MTMEATWQPLTPASIASLPEAMAAFQIGSLVRTVLYIGGDPSEGLRTAVRRALESPRLRLRAHCIRWEVTADPCGRAADLLAAHRAAHGGASPTEQPRPVPGVRVFLPLAAEAHSGSTAARAVPAPPSSAPAAKRAPAAASFLRVRTVA